jgi:hypothetical protein
LPSSHSSRRQIIRTGPYRPVPGKVARC